VAEAVARRCLRAARLVGAGASAEAVAAAAGAPAVASAGAGSPSVPGAKAGTRPPNCWSISRRRRM
jgi:hypothetical protein